MHRISWPTVAALASAWLVATGIDARPPVAGAPSSNLPIAGNWNLSTAHDELGYFDPASSTFVLCDHNLGDPLECIAVTAGERPAPDPGSPALIPLVGRWSGQAQDGIGLYDPTDGRVELFGLKRDGDCGIGCIRGAVEFGEFTLGAGGDRPVVGDWDGSSVDSLALVHPHGEVTFFDDDHTSAIGHLDLGFDASETLPIAGRWAGNTRASGPMPDSLALLLLDKDILLVIDGLEPVDEVPFILRSEHPVPLAVQWTTDTVDAPALYHQKNVSVFCTDGPCHEVERFSESFRTDADATGEGLRGTLDSRFPNDPNGG